MEKKEKKKNIGCKTKRQTERNRRKDETFLNGDFNMLMKQMREKKTSNKEE